LNHTPPQDARFEIKFVDYQTNLPKILQWVRLHHARFKKKYTEHIIHNIYFDTNDNEAFSEKLPGASNREKLRYRWYGDSITPEAGRLEFKKRRNLLGWKEIYNI